MPLSSCSWLQVDKARSWLLRAVQLARGDNGDFWALLYKLESQYGNADSQKKVPKAMSYFSSCLNIY